MVKALDVNIDTNIDSENSWDDLDTCCPKSGKMTEALAAKIEDHLERIPCDLRPEVSGRATTKSQEFVARYVQLRQPVVLVNCSASWEAQVQMPSEDHFSVI